MSQTPTNKLLYLLLCFWELSAGLCGHLNEWLTPASTPEKELDVNSGIMRSVGVKLKNILSILHTNYPTGI